MTNQQLQNHISTWFDPEVSGLEFTEKETEFLTVTISKENLYNLASKLKRDTQTQFDYLFVS